MNTDKHRWFYPFYRRDLPDPRSIGADVRTRIKQIGRIGADLILIRDHSRYSRAEKAVVRDQKTLRNFAKKLCVLCGKRIRSGE